MGWGSLSSAQQIMIKLYLLGGPQYAAELRKAGIQTAGLAKATNGVGAAMANATRHSFLLRQGLYTARRYMFYATLAATALAASVVRMGFTYNNALQGASVALRTVLKPTALLKREMTDLYTIAAKTPFQFQDITIAFRKMYAGFRPLGISLTTTNQTIQALSDALAYTGVSTPAALNRVSVALQHMANLGHITGQVVQQLARDGLQIGPILRKELGLTDDQIKNISKSGITAQQVLGALIKYTQTEPGFKGAAWRLQNETLVGAWSTFKDLLSQGAGGAEGGLFKGLQSALKGVNTQLLPLVNKRKPITILAIAEAFDKQLSPRTHIVINLFLFFRSALIGLVGTFIVLGKVISTVLRPFDALGNLFGVNHAAAKLLGYTVGIVTALLLVSKVAMLGAALAGDIYAVSQRGLRLAIIATTFAMKLQNIQMTVGLITAWRKWAFAAGAIPTVIGKYPAKFANGSMFARISRAVFGLVPAFTAAAVAAWAFIVPLLPIIGIVALVALLAGGLVILYFRWKKLHDAVNSTAHWLWVNWKYTRFLLLLLGPLGLMSIVALTIARNFERIARAVQWVIDKIVMFYRLTKKGLNYASIAGRVGTVIPQLPGHALGGRSMWGGMSLVGERGPEIVNLPQGANVIPHSQISNTLNQIDVNAQSGGAAAIDDSIPYVMQMIVNRKVLAEQTGRARRDRAARRS